MAETLFHCDDALWQRFTALCRDRDETPGAALARAFPAIRAPALPGRPFPRAEFRLAPGRRPVFPAPKHSERPRP